MLSQTGLYALQAVLRLAERGDAKTSASALAEELGIPRNYLAKVLQRLARAGMLGSSRGPGGGYSLTPSPGSLTVAQIVEPFEDFRTPESCLMGGPCDLARPCAAHARRTSWTDATMALLHETTLADLLPRATREGWEAAATPSENDR